MDTSDLNATVEIKSGLQKEPESWAHSNLSPECGSRAYYRHT